MNLLFDTSILIAIEKKDNNVLSGIKELIVFYPDLPKISFITYFEFYDGVQDKQPKNKEKAVHLLNKFTLLPTSKRTAEILSDLKRAGEKEGTPLPLADLIIASQAIEHDAILVTRDKGFSHLKTLKKIIL